MEKAGYDVEFIDGVIEKRTGEYIIQKIKEFDVIVFFTVYLAQEIDIKWVQNISYFYPDKKTVFTGPEPSYRMEEFLINKNVFIIRGEPEKIILELIKAFERNSHKYSKIRGLSWMDRKIINNPPRKPIKNLDKLPFPARHLIKHPERYFNPKLKGRPTTTMLTSRQCWGRCVYCIPLACNFAREIEYRKYKGIKPPVSLRSPKNIFEEFKLVKEQGYKSVAIMDDNFMGLPTKEGKERIVNICKLIVPLRMEWGCLARADQCLSLEVLKWMYMAGCKYIDLGVESFNEEILTYIKKGITAKQQIDAIRNIQMNNMEPKVNILLGCSPFQTEEDIKDTVRILKELNVEWASFGIVTPHPMTEYYKEIKKNKWMTTEDWIPTDPYKDGILNLPNLSQEKLQELIKWCYKEYYINWKFISRRLKNGHIIEDLKVFRKLFL